MYRPAGKCSSSPFSLLGIINFEAVPGRCFGPKTRLDINYAKRNYKPFIQSLNTYEKYRDDVQCVMKEEQEEEFSYAFYECE